MLKIVALALVAAVSLAGGRKAPAPVVVEPDPTPTASSGPSTGLRFVPVAYYSTPEERRIIARAGKLVNDTLRSDCAQKFLRTRKMIDTNGRTSSQVVDHLLGLNAEVPVEMYYRCMRNWRCPFGTSAVAYREPPSPTIHLNRAVYYSGLSLCEWASVMAHEGAGHSAGEYGHDFNWSASREFSVPYSLNHAFTQCCKEPK